MAFEPIYDVLQCDYKKRITTAQVVAECKLLTEGAIKLAKVLSISAEATVDSVEVIAGEARFSGQVNFKVLFTDNEGANHIIEQSAAFTDKAMHSDFSPTLRAVCRAHILDTDTVSVNAGEIRLASVVEISIEAIINERISYLSGTGMDIYTQEEQVEFCSIVADVYDEWTHEAEVDPKFNPLKIMSVRAAATCERVRAGLDIVSIEGRLLTEICFETEGGLLKCAHFGEPFSQEISARGVTDAALCDAFVTVANVAATLEHDEKNDKKTISLAFSLKAVACAFVEGTSTAVVDAFSVNNELNVVGENAAILKFKGTKNYSDHVEGTATLESDMPEIDNILSVCASRLNVTGAYCTEGKVTLEGVINTAVIYYNAASNTKNSISVELPFSLSFKEEYAAQNMALMARGVLGAANARIKRGNEIELSIEVCFSVAIYENKNVFVIKEIELGEERKMSKSAIAIYVTRGGESLWEIAKSLMTTPELIMAQNPSIKLPAGANERVLVYKQLQAKL